MSDEHEIRLLDEGTVTEFLEPARQIDVKLGGDSSGIREVLGKALHALVDLMAEGFENPHVGRAEGLVGHLIVDRELHKAAGDEYGASVHDPDEWEHTVHTRDDRHYRVQITEVPDDTPRHHV